MTESSEHKVYYINKTSLTREELKQSADKATAIIEVIFNKDDKTMIVSNLFSNQKGCGSALMVFASKKAVKMGITEVILDDCSEKYNQKDNLYVKMGMKYVSAGDGPEMMGKTNKVSKYCVQNKEIKEIKL
tara:strand:+ start:250 stop:642 length:393 start_codon:yes stop_codon:yes gene_type:complete